MLFFCPPIDSAIVLCYTNIDKKGTRKERIGVFVLNITTKDVHLVNPPSYETVLMTFNTAARNCYQSLNDKTDNMESAEALARKLIAIGHGSPIEMNNITFRFVGDRNFLAQLSRHRLLSLAVESARYCNYSKGKFNHSVSFVKPLGIVTEEQEKIWEESCKKSEEDYFKLLDAGCKPETARSVLNTSLATHIIASGNIREWRHVIELRCDTHAQDDIRAIITWALTLLYKHYPVFFEDLYAKYCKTDVKAN